MTREDFIPHEDDPIQNLDTVDVARQLRDGSVELGIVATAPLEDSDRVMFLICEKVRNYLLEIQSPAFKAQFGSLEKSMIRIVIIGGRSGGHAKLNLHTNRRRSGRRMRNTCGAGDATRRLRRAVVVDQHQLARASCGNGC